MRIGMLTGMLLALQLPDGASNLLAFATVLIGALGGVALSSKLDALRRQEPK